MDQGGAQGIRDVTPKRELDLIKDRYYGEYKVLVALQYLAQCGRRRPRILTTLEDWILDFHEKRGIPLES